MRPFARQSEPNPHAAAASTRIEACLVALAKRLPIGTPLTID
jgi:hypothetical protein